MMKSSAELKAIAKESLQGKWLQSIGAMFLYGLIAGVPLCSPAMQGGYLKYNVKLIRREYTNVADVFDGFSLFGKSLWLSIITGFFIYLWSLLFLIPGIIKSFSYSMAPYILAENPQMTAREALQASKDLMHGKKGQLFYLGLTFIGWFLLGAFSLGIAYIWIIPYIQATFAAFYDDAIGGSNFQNAQQDIGF